MSENINETIEEFLKENKINITGGKVVSFEQLSSILNNLALNDLNKGKIEKAMYFINEAIKFNKENHYALFIKGLIFREIHKYNESIEAFKEYYNKANDNLVFVYIGFSYAELNDTEEALSYLKKAEKEFSEDEKNKYSDLMSTVYECIGNIYMTKENILEFNEEDKLNFNYKVAIKYFKMSLKINKNNHMLLNKLAACYYHVEDINKALYCYEEAAKVAEDNTPYLEAIEEMKEMGATSETIEF